ARRLREANVGLRGIRALDARAEHLLKNLQQYGKDGLAPAVRRQIRQLRYDIARAYQPKGIGMRVASGVAVAAATAAIISLVVQGASAGEIDVSALKTATGKAALYG